MIAALLAQDENSVRLEGVVLDEQQPDHVRPGRLAPIEHIRRGTERRHATRGHRRDVGAARAP